MTPAQPGKKRKRHVKAGAADAAGGLPGSLPAPGLEVLDKSSADAEQWSSAYEQLFDRN